MRKTRAGRKVAASTRAKSKAKPSQALALIPRPGAVAALQDLADQAKGYAAGSKSENTRRAYAADWRDFTGWCGRHGLEALPAEPGTLALYLADMATASKASTIQRRACAIGQAHKLAGHTSPVADARVRSVLSGIRRKLGTAKAGRAPLSVEDLRAMSEALPASAIGTRDRALLVLGFAGALRRSELVALDLADVKVTKAGLVVTIRRSKTDQEAEGQSIGLPYGSREETCPVRSFLAWREQLGAESGPAFRAINRHGRIAAAALSAKAVALIVKRSAEAVGLEAEDLAGHSLRSGFVTAAAEAGVAERSIMNQTRHRSIAVMRSYIRGASLFKDNAAAEVGL